MNAPAPEAAPSDDPREAQRLQALAALQLLDAASIPALGAVARCTAALLSVPMAAVVVIDEATVWTLAQVGLDAAPASWPRAGSPCDRALAALVQAPDAVVAGPVGATVSPAHPLAAGAPGFHAAAAWGDDAGHVLGLVVAMAPADDRPGLDAAQAAHLRDLASLAASAVQAQVRGLKLTAAQGTDPATGAADPREFDRALGIELRHAMRTGEPFAVVQVHLEGLDDVRVAYDDASARAVLLAAAQRVGQQVRLGDVFARTGEEDFAIVMRHGGEAEAQGLAARIQAAVRQPVDVPAGDRITPVVTLGIGAYTDDTASVAEVLDRAAASLAQSRAEHLARWERLGPWFGRLEATLTDPGV